MHVKFSGCIYCLEHFIIKLIFWIWPSEITMGKSGSSEVKEMGKISYTSFRLWVYGIVAKYPMCSQIPHLHLLATHLCISKLAVQLQVCMHSQSLSHVQFFATPRIVRLLCPRDFLQEYWSRLPFPSPGELPDSGIKPESPALALRRVTWEACLQLDGIIPLSSGL